MRRRFPSRQSLAAPVPTPLNGRKLFAYHLRRLRQARGLTQEGLAEAAGLDRGYVSMLENCHRNVSLDSICALAAALGVEPYEMLLPK